MAILKKLSFGKKGNALKRGRFIVIDGTDGSGKSTQFEQLHEILKTEGYDVVTIKFPQYGQKSAGVVEEYLAGKYGSLNPQAASILYSVDRFDASFKIRTLVNQGKIVLCDRYVTANAAHQGGKIPDQPERIQFFKWLDNVEYGIFNIPKPDLNLILHVPAEVSQKLIIKREKNEGQRKMDIHELDFEHLKNAEKVYLEIAKLFPNTKLVECMNGGTLMSIQEIHNRIWELVRRIALKGVPTPAPERK